MNNRIYLPLWDILNNILLKISSFARRLTIVFLYFGRPTIKRSLSDGNIFCESHNTIRDLNVTNCQHSSEKTDKHRFSESTPDIFTCGSAICHCRYA